MERSGTKWLTSILRKHPEIAAPESPEGGVFEASFENFNYHFPDLTRPDDYIACVELFSKTDLFEKLNIDKDYFYKIENKPSNYYQLLGLAFDKYAESNNSKYWIQKASPRVIKYLLNNFKNARFIIIKRNLVDNIKSKMASTLMSTGSKRMYHKIFQYALQEKFIIKLSHNKETIKTVDYKDLKINQANVIRSILELLNLEFNYNLLIENKENIFHSKFQNDNQRQKILNKQEVHFAKIFYFFMKLLPSGMLKFIHKVFSKPKYKMIAGTFSTIMLKHNLLYKKNKLDDIIKSGND